MTNRITTLKQKIIDRYPGSAFQPFDNARLTQIFKQHPTLPDELRLFLEIFGHGSIGDSKYRIHGWLDPEKVFDPITARKLKHIIIVGDDFAGTCEAYDLANCWQFGTLDSDGEFLKSDEYDGIVSFLEDWYLREDA